MDLDAILWIQTYLLPQGINLVSGIFNYLVKQIDLLSQGPDLKKSEPSQDRARQE